MGGGGGGLHPCVLHTSHFHRKGSWGSPAFSLVKAALTSVAVWYRLYTCISSLISRCPPLPPPPLTSTPQQAISAGEMAREKWTKDLKAANLSATDVLPESGSWLAKSPPLALPIWERRTPRWVRHYFLQFHGTGEPTVLLGPWNGTLRQNHPSLVGAIASCFICGKTSGAWMCLDGFQSAYSLRLL